MTGQVAFFDAQPADDISHFSEFCLLKEVWSCHRLKSLDHRMPSILWKGPSSFHCLCVLPRSAHRTTIASRDVYEGAGVRYQIEKSQNLGELRADSTHRAAVLNGNPDKKPSSHGG